MSIALRRPLSFFSAIALFAFSTWVQAGLIPVPASGNPSSVGPINGYTVSLIPDPAVYMSVCPWLLPAAQTASQPYNNATNVWNFTYSSNFNGTFTLNTYAAANNGTNGGANFSISYTAGTGDPTDGDVRWMQVIDTNLPTARGVTYGVVGTGLNGIPLGTTAYLDNAGPGAQGTPLDPYYGWLTVTTAGDLTSSTAANAQGFLDTPSLPLVAGRVWEAQAFLATETQAVDNNTGITTHDVSIMGGVWWGFQVVPEPGTLLLLMVGVVLLLFVRRSSNRTVPQLMS